MGKSRVAGFRSRVRAGFMWDHSSTPAPRQMPRWLARWGRPQVKRITPTTPRNAIPVPTAVRQP